jgi:acyl carrier protein
LREHLGLRTLGSERVMGDSEDVDGMAAAVELLRRVAPDRDASAVDPDGALHDELGIDSVDVVTLMELVGELTGEPVPVRRYPELGTFRQLAAHLDRARRR